MHALFEQQDGSHKVLIREDLINNDVIRWAYQIYIDKLRQITIKLASMGLPVDRGNARYPQM